MMATIMWDYCSLLSCFRMWLWATAFRNVIFYDTPANYGLQYDSLFLKFTGFICYHHKLWTSTLFNIVDAFATGFLTLSTSPNDTCRFCFDIRYGCTPSGWLDPIRLSFILRRGHWKRRRKDGTSVLEGEMEGTDRLKNVSMIYCFALDKECGRFLLLGLAGRCMHHFGRSLNIPWIEGSEFFIL